MTPNPNPTSQGDWKARAYEALRRQGFEAFRRYFLSLLRFWLGFVPLLHAGCIDNDSTSFGQLKPVQAPAELLLQVGSPVASIQGFTWQKVEGKLEDQASLKKVNLVVIEIDKSHQIRTTPKACILSQEGGKLSRIKLFYSGEPLSLDDAVRKIEMLSTEYLIATAPEVVNYLKKLREENPQPMGGRTRAVTVDLTNQLQVSLILQASPNENGWYVQSYFGPPL